MGDWSVQRIEQLAPDAASMKAGQGLAKPGKWQNLGRTERLVWGECQGSGANPYQVRIDLDDVAYKCTCPSRKLPCKHTLGLLLLLSQGSVVSIGTPPAFVEEWSANRAKRAEAKQTRAAQPEAPPDPQAKARRVEKRENRIVAGLDQLETWLSDLVRQGLASARAQPSSYWTQMSARLVDAQAPGLARRVSELADIAMTVDWQSRLLVAIAKLQLLIDGYRNLDRLPPELAAEVRSLIGWTQEQEALREREGVRDRWQVVARRQSQTEQLRVQHTWLHGETSDRMALILEFAVGNQPLPANYSLGQQIDAELVFFESATPLRALEKQRHESLAPKFALTAGQSVQALQAAHADRIAVNPWIDSFPVLLGPATPFLQQDRLWLRDAGQRSLPVASTFRHAWHLIALAAGDSMTVFGEWNGEALDPLTVECRGELYAVARLDDLAVLSRVA